VTYQLRASWAIPDTGYELQEIQGSDGSIWLRTSQDNVLLAVFSAAKQGPGVMPAERVEAVLAEAMTARKPHVIINALRFLGWEFWPATPIPLKGYLHGGFRDELSRAKTICAFPE
jgi:hypothetical protein